MERACDHYDITPEEYYAHPEYYPLPERGSGLAAQVNSVACCSCSYPIAVTRIGQQVTCPFCGETGIVKSVAQENGGVTVPTWLVIGTVSFIAGGILWPALMATTEEGSKRLAELSRKYVARK